MTFLSQALNPRDREYFVRCSEDIRGNHIVAIEALFLLRLTPIHIRRRIGTFERPLQFNMFVRRQVTQRLLGAVARTARSVLEFRICVLNVQRLASASSAGLESAGMKDKGVRVRRVHRVECRHRLMRAIDEPQVCLAQLASLLLPAYIAICNVYA